ncbi:MAG: protein phosphatase 2C domain-containing protein [Saccharofermentans sp.]|nr:protein phosphatase 2C domain-containing protein [Saccharofermentans sp.]
MICCGATEKGPVRENNEDYFGFAECAGYTCMAIADGLGGESSGEVASKLAVEEALACLKAELPMVSDKNELFDIIHKAFNKANVKVLLNSLDNRERLGMCTTLTLALVKDTEVTIGHIGDTRCYLMHGSTVMKLTKDHNEAAMLVKSGKLVEEEAKKHPGRNRLFNVVGVNKFLNPDIYSYNVIYGDLVILCSDGLYAPFTDNDLAGLIRNNKADLEGLCDKLIKEALSLGSKDNLTVLIGNTSRK